MSKNIVEKYTEFNGQLIILISGLSGSGKTQLGENIGRDFKLKKIDMKKFYKKDFDEKVKLANGMSVVNYDSDGAIDWDKMNEEINNMKKDGIIVIGHVFPTDKLNFKADYHIHLKISKQKLKTNRLEYIEKHKENGFDPESEELRINALTYPYYLGALKRMKMDKFIDVSDMSDDVVYDIIFDEIIKYIKENVYSSHNHSKKSNQGSASLLSPVASETESSEEIIPYDNDYIVSYSDNAN
jgi:cytidylate kinase